MQKLTSNIRSDFNGKHFRKTWYSTSGKKTSVCVCAHRCVCAHARERKNVCVCMCMCLCVMNVHVCGCVCVMCAGHAHISACPYAVVYVYATVVLD